MFWWGVGAVPGHSKMFSVPAHGPCIKNFWTLRGGQSLQPQLNHSQVLAAMAWQLPKRLTWSLSRLPSNVASNQVPHWLHLQRATFSTDGLGRWQRHSDRLEGLLRRVKCPKIESFEVNGEVYQLPLSVAMPKEAPSQEELEYLCGNFDGDGCVSMDASSGRMSLVVSQAIERVEILTRFRDALGGAIYREKDATGFRSACLRWQASGRAAQRAASILSTFCSMKQGQLKIAARMVGGVVPAGCRPEVTQRLALLKGSDYQPPEGTPKCTWHYFAGIFDADGSITIRAESRSIYLTLSQVNPVVLHSLLGFLQAEGFQYWKLYYNQRDAMLRCMHLASVKSCLGQLIESHLTLKKMQAEACMTHTPQNHFQIREYVSQLNGHQGFYSRLDHTEIEKAKEINRQRRKIRRMREQNRSKDCNNTLLEAAENELQNLLEEMTLCKVMSRCNKLRSQLRKLMREGATIIPSTPNLPA